MAQTTDAISARAYKIEISTDGSSWTEISGYANTIAPGGGARMAGDAYTFDGDTAITTVGKREPFDITISILYTEGGSDPVETIRGWDEAATQVYVRYSPAGGATGDFQYTAQGYFTEAPKPEGDASSGDPVLVEMVFHTPELVKSVVA